MLSWWRRYIFIFLRGNLVGCRWPMAILAARKMVMRLNERQRLMVQPKLIGVVVSWGLWGPKRIIMRTAGLLLLLGWLRHCWSCSRFPQGGLFVEVDLLHCDPLHKSCIIWQVTISLITPWPRPLSDELFHCSLLSLKRSLAPGTIFVSRTKVFWDRSDYRTRVSFLVPENAYIYICLSNIHIKFTLKTA